ncbi:hypothetical protein E4T43_09068 [Aureobasidium subglaciale]|nr:hypothetical protein E4T43_09068 [Aureobasidium subglaciale]
MELSQSAARALARCRPLSLYSTPLYRNRLSPFAIRSFTTTRMLRQDQPDAFIRQLKQEEQETRSHDTSAAAGEDAAPAPAPQSNLPESINDLMDKALDGFKGVPTTSEQRTSRYPTPSAQQKHRVQPASANGTSTADLFANFRTSNQVANVFNVKREISPVKPLDFTPGPTLGKTVRIGPAGDVGRAFRQVEQLCSRNRVRADFNKQRFHERPGLKRKRLHSERWRRRFKEAFRGTVKMVNKMRKQGW